MTTIGAATAMSLTVARVAALIGWLAHAVGRGAGGVVWFAPRRTPWALIVALLLIVAAWSWVVAARATTAAEPRPVAVGLGEVVDLRATGWVGTATIVRGPFLDSDSYGAPVRRWYYLLVDPHDDAVAMVARSAERLEERRTRTIMVRVTIDEAAVADAATDLDVAGLRLDPGAYLVELDGRRPSALTGDAVLTPAGWDGATSGEIVLRAEFGDARRGPGGDGWEYLASDGDRAVIVRSPHAPDALPVDVWGVAATDALRMGQALAVPELEAAVDGRRTPARRLLEEGVSPPFSEVTYVPAMLLSGIAALLAAGWLFGYPFFRREPLPNGVRTWPLATDDAVSVDLYGTDRRVKRVGLDAAPARLELLRPDELERREWQYSLRDAVGRAPTSGADRLAGPPRLVLSSGQGPILAVLDPPPSGMRLAAGRLVTAGGSRAALRIRADGLDLVGAFATDGERDRALAAIDPTRLVPALLDARPARVAPRTGALAGEGRPVPLRAAAAILVAVGAVFIAVGAIGLPDAMADPSELPTILAQLGVGTGFAAVGRGVWLTRDWAQGLGFNVAWVGAAIAAFLVVAAPQCGLWLAPNLAACETAGPIGGAVAAGAAIGLAYVALAVRRYASAFTR